MSRRASAVRFAPAGKVRRRAPVKRGLAMRSWQAILVTLGLLIAQAPMIAHLLIVRHVTCEHGALVEGSGHTARHDSSLDAIDAEEASAGEQASPGGGAEAEHDHCDALALRHRPSEMAMAVGPAMLLEIERSVSIGRGREERPVALLSLAPKGSPPVT